MVTGGTVTDPPPDGPFCAWACVSPTAAVTNPIASTTATPTTANSILAFRIVESDARKYQFTREFSDRSLEQQR